MVWGRGGGGGKVPTTPKHNVQQPQKPTSQALPSDGQSSPASAGDQNCAQWLFKLRFTIKFKISDQIQIHNRWSKHNQQSIKTRNGANAIQCLNLLQVCHFCGATCWKHTLQTASRSRTARLRVDPSSLKLQHAVSVFTVKRLGQ